MINFWLFKTLENKVLKDWNMLKTFKTWLEVSPKIPTRYCLEPNSEFINHELIVVWQYLIVSVVEVLHQVLPISIISGSSITRSAPECVPGLEVLTLLRLLPLSVPHTNLWLLHHLAHQLVLVHWVGMVHLMPSYL